jgi:hypothetical protein
LIGLFLLLLEQRVFLDPITSIVLDVSKRPCSVDSALDATFTGAALFTLKMTAGTIDIEAIAKVFSR